MGDTPNSVTLYELNSRVKSGVRELFPDNYWITGEISELNINQSGHCYLELIEKREDTEQIIARAKATIWSFTFRMLRPYFESVTSQRLSAGIKIMVQVSVEFHEVYGFSLNIKDIEPNFTLGDLSRKRQEIIQRLHDEGVFHLNKELTLSLVPQRIAVISSETAAGYGDFVDQLTKNRSGFKFVIKLFKAYMQGEEAEQSIINALERIFESIDNYDLVVIIRGGGSQADLNCFNSYWLSYHITQFPLPIVTGIGHERDETIVDLVAHTNLKTPTAVAEFIINAVLEFDDYIDQLKNQIFSLSSDRLNVWKDETARLSRNIISLAKLRMSREDQKIESLALMSRKSLKGYLQKNYQRLANAQEEVVYKLRSYFQYKKQHLSITQKNLSFVLKSYLKEEISHLASMEGKLQLLDPVHILKRGYTLTYSKGKLIKSVLQLKPGDKIESKWIDGIVLSTVDELLKPQE